MSLISTAVTCAPWLGMRVDDVLDLVVDRGNVGQELIEAEAADHVAHRGLADLVNRISHILDRDHGLFRIGDVIIGDRRDIDRDVVLGDDLLRRDLHRHRTQRHPRHGLQRHQDQRQPRTAHALELAEEEHHPALILLDHPERDEGVDNDEQDQKRKKAHGAFPNFSWVAVTCGRHSMWAR
jgi:hypothetical protein